MKKKTDYRICDDGTVDFESNWKPNPCRTWEDKFDRSFGWGYKWQDEIKDFIRQTLHRERQSVIRKIGHLKSGWEEPPPTPGLEAPEDDYECGYFDALDQMISYLKRKDK